MRICHDGRSLTGIADHFAAVAATGPVSPIMVAYVPHDPEHPLKQYPSSLEFMAELTRQLRENATCPHAKVINSSSASSCPMSNADIFLPG